MEQPDWEAADITHPHHRIFVLQWIELFDDASLDTWQVRSTNLLSLLREVEAVAHIAATDHPPTVAALRPLADEAIGSAGRDLVMKGDFPWVAHELDELKKRVNELPERPTLGALESIGRTARVIRERIARDYRQHLLARIRAVLSGPGREKEEQMSLTMSLATALAAEGYSLRHLTGVGELLLNPQEPFLDRVEELLGLCDQTPRDYQVHFTVREWEPQVSLRRERCWLAGKVAARDRLPKVARVEEFLAGAEASDRVVSLPATGLDPYAARLRAESQLTRDFAAIAITTYRDPVVVGRNEQALVIDSNNDVALLAPADGSRRNAVRRSRDWLDRTEVLLRMGEVLSPEDHRQLSATLQYFRLALTHPSDEVRLVNLWVAAETLVRRAGTGSIIGRVTSLLAPLLATRNVRRVAKGLARRLSTVRYKELRHVGLLAKNSKQVDPLVLLQKLRNEGSGREVLALLDHDPLTRLRLYRFMDKALKSGATAAAYLENNRQNIEWQLGRIYRARNAIVHRGEAPTSTRQLLQHLETYVWTAIRQVTTELAHAEGRWSLSDALEHFRGLHDHAVRVLRASETPPLEALLEPAMFLRLSIPQAGAAQT